VSVAHRLSSDKCAPLHRYCDVVLSSLRIWFFMHSAAGNSFGIRMFGATAEYDDVVVTTP
jgi:hypothetical protein